MKIGNPIGSKSYHRLTPSIGVVKSRPIKTETESIKRNEWPVVLDGPKSYSGDTLLSNAVRSG